MSDLITVYLFIGLVWTMVNMPYHMHFRTFLESAVSALVFLFLWPVALLVWALWGLHAAIGWVLEKVLD